jgi:hypothetical protein
MSRKKLTNEQFIDKLQIINVNIVVLEKYINSSIKLLCKCKIDNFEWYAKPYTLLDGNGCPKCKVTKMVLERKLSQKEFIKRVIESNSNIEIIGEYINNHSNVDAYCSKHNVYFSKSASLLMKGIGCKKCCSENYSNIQNCSYETFMKEFEKYKSKIEIIGEYKNYKELTLFKCKIDEHEWMAQPGRIVKGIGCPKCSGMIKTDDEFKKELELKNPNIISLQKYINNKTKILCRCLLDDYEWMIKPSDVLKISGCPMCKKLKMRQYLGESHEGFIERMKIINPYIIIIGQYINRNEKILCRCLIDNCEWMANPGHLLNHHGCPECYQKSRGEIFIKNILKKYNIFFISQHKFNDCKDKRKLSFDFYLPESNMCIEYQGGQHYKQVDFFGGKKQLEDQQRRDEIKRNYCINKNIYLLEIPFWNFKNIESILYKELLPQVIGKEVEFGSINK